jgi:hypothetical protein
MVVQTFGNRILGGIGAPGGGMSEAFGAGVNTALGQRESRQVMNIRAQDQQFKIEDREEAKRRRAAAASAAAASKARTEAMNERYRSILGVPGTAPAVAGLTLPAATAAPAAPAAPAPAAPAAAGVRPAYTPLSFGGGRVVGGAGSSSVGGGSGEDLLTGVPVLPASDETAAESISRGAGPVREYVYDQAGNFLGTTDRIIGNIVGAAEGVVGLGAGAVGLGASALGYPEFGQSMFDTAGQRFVDAERMAREGYFGANAAAPATGVVTTPAATEAATTAAAAGVPPEVSVTLPDGQQLVLSTGTVAPRQPTQLTFGPKLGSPDRTQEDIFVDELMMRTGADQRPPAPPAMGEPGAPNRAVTRLMSERDRQVQLAQAALEFNDMQTYQAAASKIMELDVALEAGVARMAISELRYSNAPQRLNAILTEITGMQHEYVPTAAGVYDKYVNGELYQQGMDMNAIAEETLMLADANYAQQQAALATMEAEARAKGMGEAAANVSEYEAKAAIDVDKALSVGLTELDLLAMKRDLGFGEQDAIDFQTDEQTGIIMVFRNGEPTAQYRPVTEIDATGNEITRYEQVY